jgi:hypothetical protein
MNETRPRGRVVVDTRFADLPNSLFDNCKIAVLVREERSSEQLCQALIM